MQHQITARIDRGLVDRQTGRRYSKTGKANLRRAVGLGLIGCLGTLLGLGLSSPASAQEPEVRVELNPKGEVGLKEIIQLTVEIQSPPRGTRPPVFQAENLKVVGGPSHSTSVQFFNGVSSQTMSYTWMLQPLALGAARIHQIRLDTGSKTLNLADQALQVVENPPPRAPRRRSADPFSRDPIDSLLDSTFPRQRPRRQRQAPPPEIFLEAEIQPKRPLVGQQALYTLYLYTDVNVRSVTPTELPDFKGFWAKPIPQPEDTRPERVIRDGREIGRVVLLERALFPRREGRLEIEPVQATMTALIRDSSVFGSLLPRMGEIDRTSNTLTVDVQPLPDPPEAFSGVVGRVDLKASLEPRILEIGDAATLTLTLEGEGHLQGAQAPVIPELEGLQIFPPQHQSEESLKGHRVHGKRIWSYVLVPQRPGTIELSTISLTYFDPRRRQFNTTAVEGLGLQIKGSTRATQQSGQEVQLHSIRTALLPSVSGNSLLGLGKSWRHGLILLPWILFGLVWTWRRRGTGAPGGSNPRRGLRSELRRALAEARHEEVPRRTAALVEDAWRAYLEARWEIPKGAPSSQWSSLLQEQKVSSAVAEEIVRLVEDLHYLRYAPKLSSTDEMRAELLSRSERLSKKL